MPRNLLVLFFAFALMAQKTAPPPKPDAVPDPGVQLPNGKWQSDEILKAEHKKNLDDAATMAKLAEEVREELDKDDRYVLSLRTLKNLDDIEKLSKAIRGRLKK